MRSYRKFVALAGAVLLVTAFPSFAGARGPSKGTWTFTDVTPNPTVFGTCSGSEVLSAPSDVNTYEIKVTKKIAQLTTTSHNNLDWAAEVRDSNGNIIESVDGGLPTDHENLSILLAKGTYTVGYCNWLGEPSITVDWTLK